MEIDSTKISNLRRILDQKHQHYDQIDFIAKDPIAVPHRIQRQQDIEIAAFFAAILAWGNRTMILRNANRIMGWMDESPHDFLLNHKAEDLKPLLHFVHRTFNATDLLYSIEFLKTHYQSNSSLESAFFPKHLSFNVQEGLIYFHHYFFSLPDAPDRTRKHIANPERKSACKRLNMFLRWMVRQDSVVDFGIWKRISANELRCPLDTHVGDVARKLGLLVRKQSDWKAALELTTNLRLLDPNDPVKYDFALFGMGDEEKW